jgi:peptidoglycan hydrolase-like protein with peptidoglycan-binding domain
VSAGRPASAISRRRRVAPAGLGLALAALAVVLVVGDPFGGSGRPTGGGEEATSTSLATVTQQTLSSQTQVDATLGYEGATSIRVPTGTPPSAVQQAEQTVASGERALQGARASLAEDSTTVENAQATVTAEREKEAVDCEGDNAAESVPGASSPSGEAASTGAPASGTDASVCASDVQTLASDEQSSSGAATKLHSDRASLSSAQAALGSAEAAASTARSAVADYGQGSTFTMLPAVGRVIVRGQSLFALGGRPTVLMYGAVLPSRAFVAGMPPGRDVGALNANLEALGYGTGLGGETFSGATQAAIGAFQSAHGMTVTGELPLGSVVFEGGPVRVTSVMAELGASVTPGRVLGITSTHPQVTIALSAAEQSSVKVGDRASITLPSQQTTPGVITSVGTVAKAPAEKGGGGGGEPGEEGGPTIEVGVTPSEPRAIGHLDEAPVAVSITTASVPNALAVPVDALLALAGDSGAGAAGYALEVVEHGVHRLEEVTLGLFDDAEGLVQVSGPGVSAGQRVVVPST